MTKKNALHLWAIFLYWFSTDVSPQQHNRNEHGFCLAFNRIVLRELPKIAFSALRSFGKMLIYVSKLRFYLNGKS
jgi:hypothetical protein